MPNGINYSFPINVAPTLVNKDAVFFIYIVYELIFVFWCYTLLTIPDINCWYAGPVIILLRWFVTFASKGRASGVYVIFLKREIDKTTDKGLLYAYEHQLEQITKHNSEFYNECKTAKRWKENRD